MKRVYIFLLSFVFAFSSSYAQRNDLTFERTSIDDGLSQVCVNAILQDKQGYMWFATQDGLNKFDGYSFKIYKPDVGDKKSLSNNTIKAIYEDRDGNLWIGTAGGGLNKFDRESETFTCYSFDPFDHFSISNNDVYAIFQDHTGALWVGTYGGGLNKLDIKTGRFTRYMHNPDDITSISGNAIRTINEDKNGNLWIGVDEGGLNLFNRKTETFRTFRYNAQDQNSICSDVVMSIYVDSDNSLWIGTYGGGLDKFNTRTEIFTHFKHGGANTISSNTVWTIYGDGGDNLWIGTRGAGINVFSKTSGTFKQYQHDPNKPNSLSGNNVLSFCKDKSGILWIGTENNGLNKYDFKFKKFELYQYQQNTDNCLSSNNVFSIYQDEDALWVGTRGGGLNRIDNKTKQFTHYKSAIGDNLNYNNILSFEDDGDMFWLGSDGQGFFQFNKRLGKPVQNFRFDPTQRNTISNNAVTSLYKDKHGVLWIGTYGGGLNKFDTRNNSFHNYQIDKDNFMSNVVWCMMQDTKGILWIGSGGRGLVRLDPKTDRYIYFENNRNDKHSLSNNVVMSMLEASDGTIWVGTGGGGLNRFDRKTAQFTAYTQKDGLCNDMILGILEDEKGDIWVSTYNGLSRFDPRKKIFTNYYKNEGLQANSFNERACFRAKDGKMYFGGQNGLTAFYPDSIQPNSFVPPVVITDLKIFNKSVGVNSTVLHDVILKKSIGTVDHIELSYKHNEFSLEFAALYYGSPMNNKYRYKMEGFDENWIETDASKRFATYTNLSGGDYVFHVIASNSDGVWNEKGATLYIHVTPPFYKTAWFYTIAVFIVLVGIYIFIRVREKQLIKDKNILEGMVTERTQEIQQQKEEISSQNEALLESKLNLEKKNNTINDSISYAKRIQDAMLPSDEMLARAFTESFVVYKPKDIVSGDFYWFYEQKDRLYIVAADCTGHGVPGAFMSMIGSTLLNDIIIEQKETQPDRVLQKLNTGVITALKQTIDSRSSQDDGMDISLCYVDKTAKKVRFSCANQIIHIITGDSIETIQGDPYSIGGMFSTHSERIYTSHEFDLQAGMSIYMFSDGYQDQFGGPKGKKFLASQFKQILLDNRNLSMNDQKIALSQTFDIWKGNHRQLDDVLVIGFKL